MCLLRKHKRTVEEQALLDQFQPSEWRDSLLVWIDEVDCDGDGQRLRTVWFVDPRFPDNDGYAVPVPADGKLNDTQITQAYLEL